jgi:hypothetical protein
MIRKDQSQIPNMIQQLYTSLVVLTKGKILLLLLCFNSELLKRKIMIKSCFLNLEVSMKFSMMMLLPVIVFWILIEWVTRLKLAFLRNNWRNMLLFLSKMDIKLQLLSKPNPRGKWM